jgi:hypothetical protein
MRALVQRVKDRSRQPVIRRASVKQDAKCLLGNPPDCCAGSFVMGRAPAIVFAQGCLPGMGPWGQIIGFPGPPDGSPAIVAGGGMKVR